MYIYILNKIKEHDEIQKMYQLERGLDHSTAWIYILIKIKEHDEIQKMYQLQRDLGHSTAWRERERVETFAKRRLWESDNRDIASC